MKQQRDETDSSYGWDEINCTYGCYFCERELPEFEADDAPIEILITPEWACYAEGHLDFDDMSDWEHVCVVCAERLVGPDWFQKGRAAIAKNDAFEAAARDVPAWMRPWRTQ